MTRYALAAALLGLTGGLSGCVGGPPPPEPLNPVRLLLVGDLVADSTGNLARVATVRKRIAATGPVVFAASGNILRHMSVAALNGAGLRYATFGSDELTLPIESLEAKIAESKFTWLSANCEVAGRTAAPRLKNAREWDTLRISTHKVGIFGVTFAGTYSTDTSGVTASVRCSNPVQAARRTIDTLAAAGAELIIALTHQATADDRSLLLEEARLDLILGGRDSTPQTVALAGRYALKAGLDARQVQFVTLWGGKGKWRQAVALIPIDDRLPKDALTTPVPADTGKKKPD